MEFISFENGMLKYAGYRDDGDSLASAQTTQRRRKRQIFDNVNLIAPSYTQNLLSPDAAPFTCTPEKVCFVNYDVGKEYSFTVSFLNRTTVPKTFRVMPILPKFANALQFEYDVPPRISPGLSWDVVLRFRPRENIDFSTALYVKTEEGYLALPISTSRKSFVFSVQPKSVDFGTVVVGEEQTRHITLRNKGALSGTVVVGGSFKSLLELKHTNPVSNKKLSFFKIFPQQYKIEVPPFSTFDVAVHFAPLCPVKIDTDITLTDKSSAREVFTVPITGVSTELPVYLTNSKLDFGACFFNEQYWDEVTIVNRTNITAIADFRVPAALSAVVSVSPARVNVQPGEQYTVQVSIITSKKMLRNFASTVECAVRGQTLPLPLNITATLSERCPQIATTAFDLGKVTLNTSHLVEIPVTNEAGVVQLVGFEILPPWITASPEVVEMVPHETAIFRLTVEPPQKGRFSQRLRVVNEFGDSQVVTISGQGCSAPFSMASRTLLLPPCNVGGCVSATTVLFNSSGQAGEFSFKVPSSCFKVSPNTGILQPGESIPIAVIFNAPVEYETVELSQQPVVFQRPPKSKKDTLSLAASESITFQKRAMYDDWEAGDGEVGWSRHRQFRLKCDINGDGDDSFFFTVRCCATKPLVAIEESDSASKAVAAETQAESSSSARQNGRKAVVAADTVEQVEADPRPTFETFIDYGKVPIHCVSLRQCMIANRDTEHFFVRAPPISPLAAFSVLSYPFNGVARQCTSSVSVAFHPRKYGRFNEVLEFELEAKSGSRTKIRIRVQGACSPTQLTISMADSNTSAEKDVSESLSRLLFSCTQKNDSVRKCLNFLNVGTSPLAVVIKDTTAAADALRAAGSVERSFLVHPRIFTVQPNSKQSVTVVFAPTDEGLHSQRLSIVASGENREVALDGRCVKGAVYALVPHTSPRDGRVVALSFLEDVGCRPEYPVSLTFEENEVKTVVIGSVVNGPSGEYELQNWEQARPLAAHANWIITPLAQVIGSGKETRLSIQRVVSDGKEARSSGSASSGGALFPLRFTVVLKGEAANVSPRRAIYVVCTSD